MLITQANVQKNPNGNDAMHDRLPGEIIAGNAYSLNKRANKQLYNPKHTKPHLQKLRHSTSLTTCGAKKTVFIKPEIT